MGVGRAASYRLREVVRPTGPAAFCASLPSGGRLAAVITGTIVGSRLYAIQLLPLTASPKTRKIEMDPKMMMDVPPQLREFAGQSVDQAEQAFGAFIDAASKSAAMIPAPAGDVSKQVLSIAEQNVKASFEHARKLLGAKDVQEMMQIQSDFLKAQFATATEHMKQFGAAANGGFKV
jgi:phasin